MSQLPAQGPVIEVRPQPNVYTILLMVAVVALAAAVSVAAWKLMSQPPVGYGLQLGDLFKSFSM
jgi:hypothetical protein